MQYFKKSAYLFLLPTIIGLLLFRLIPVIFAFFTSFTDWDIYSPPVWIGLENYTRIFQSGEFWQILRNTLLFTAIYTVGVCIIGLFFAMLLNQRLKGIKFFRSLFFLPVITSIVAVGIIWNWILSPQNGILNILLDKIFNLQEPISWLGDPDYALIALALVYIWKSVGYQMLIFLAGLQNIPTELQEAAQMDGANKWKVFTKVTLPLLTPTIFFVLVITIIESFHTFGITHSMTQGGPYNATNTLSYFIYQNAFVHFNMGYASSLSFVLFILILVITWINFLYRKKWVNY
ncbi:carbohydrate ABC transporter permease [Oceanobacillus chungangensis]|uniref:Sugar ABC transporter permease n=1 Tax=Oceanobacillus chungangensis TaxID=1229152 RepID=A0A3D8PIN3_9BACI|nr:sugar ABC transporter permease [Oceanobacillus chungangensis]RDW15347.1 sugar ABC transporter permease [Oceanobacillus chungangensis]